MSSAWIPDKDDRLSAAVVIRFFPETIREINSVLKIKDNRQRWRTHSEFIRAAVQHFIQEQRGGKK